MTGRERTLAAIRHELPDRLPIDVIGVENGLTPDQLGLDGRVLAAETFQGPEPFGGADTINDYGTARAYPLADAEDVAAVDAYAWPDAGQYDFSGLRATARTWQNQYAVRGPYWVSKPLFCTACGLMGMETAMMKMLTAPAAYEACIDRIFAFSLDYVTRFVDQCGDALDILYLADDFASQRGLLFQPELWRKFLKPRYAALFEIGKRRGLPVWFHSCGDITAVLPDLIDIGMDVWETVQLHTLPMSPEALKRQFGRHITFFGGISTQQLPFASPDGVRAEVERVIVALGEGGGYICGPDHHIKPDVPRDNALALFDQATRFRRQGFTA